MEPLISIRDLKRVYKMGDENVYALNGINLDIYKGEILCLLGTSGSGKSTLLNMIAGLDRPSSGKIKIGNLDFTSLTEAQITHFRQLNIGFVFQSYNLIPTLSAIDNVALGLIFKGVPKKKRDEISKEILTKVGLGDRMYHKPSQMSGGQQQRVSIARAFVDKPKIVFADEPTGNLDTKTSFEVMNLMCQMARDYNQTLIIVTHDVETSIYSDRIVELRDGKIVREELNEAKISKDGVIRDDIFLPGEESSKDTVDNESSRENSSLDLDENNKDSSPDEDIEEDKTLNELDEINEVSDLENSLDEDKDEGDSSDEDKEINNGFETKDDINSLDENIDENKGEEGK